MPGNPILSGFPKISTTLQKRERSLVTRIIMITAANPEKY